jgi:acetyl-CoA acetyltransferase family protein
MADAVIVSAVRTALGKKQGALSKTRADDLLAHALKAAVGKAGIPASLVEDVVAGCVTQVGEQGFNIARVAALLAGFPVEVSGTSVNRQCGSSQQAFHFAAMAVMSGQMDVVLAGGVESMSRVPMGSDGMVQPSPWFPPSAAYTHKFVMQHESAEMVADKWGITRRQCEELALASHQRAAAAIEKGRFKDEVAPIEALQPDGTRKIFEVDEGVRANSTLEKMATLAPVVRPTGCVTAATSSQISDGAAAILVMSAARAKELGLRPLAKVLATAVVGVDPTMMLHGPIPATQKALARAGLKMGDIGLVEINEAFASVPLAWQKEMGLPNLDQVNVNGGAMALGHPLGASGCRLLTTLVHEMTRRDVRYGLSTMCIGFGQATATILDRKV